MITSVMLVFLLFTMSIYYICKINAYIIQLIFFFFFLGGGGGFQQLLS